MIWMPVLWISVTRLVAIIYQLLSATIMMDVLTISVTPRLERVTMPIVPICAPICPTFATLPTVILWRQLMLNVSNRLWCVHVTTTVRWPIATPTVARLDASTRLWIVSLAWEPSLEVWLLV
jgi:hypothetical protein